MHVNAMHACMHECCAIRLVDSLTAGANAGRDDPGEKRPANTTILDAAPQKKRGKVATKAAVPAGPRKKRGELATPDEVPLVYSTKILNSKTTKELITTLRRSFGKWDLSSTCAFLYSRKRLIEYVLKLQEVIKPIKITLTSAAQDHHAPPVRPVAPVGSEGSQSPGF